MRRLFTSPVYDGDAISAPFSFYRMVLTALFVTSMLTGGFLGGKVVLIGGVAVSGASLIFPLTYYLLVIMAEVYGPPTAWRLTWIGLGCLIVAWGAVELVIAVPAAPGYELDAASLHHLYSVGVLQFALIAVAFFTGQTIALLAFYGLRRLVVGRLLFFRLAGIPTIAQVVVTLFVLPVLLSDHYSVYKSAVFVAQRCIIAVGLSAFLFPLLYVAVKTIRRQERMQTLKEASNGTAAQQSA